MDKKEKKGKIMIHELKQLSQKEVMLMIEGALEVIVKNEDYFYQSGVDKKFSKLTPMGLEMVGKSMTALLPLLAVAHEQDLIEKAKKITFDTLSKEDVQ